MEVTQIILICFIVLLIIMYPVMMYLRNKKENLRMQEQTNSLKIGDKVLTTNGIYGKIVGTRDEFDRKVITLETGDENNKGYVSVDAYAIYRIFEDGTPETLNKEDEASNKSENEESFNEQTEEANITDTDVESEDKETINEIENETNTDDNTDDTPKSEEWNLHFFVE